MSPLLSTLHRRLLVKSVDQDGNERPVETLDNDSIRPTRAKDRTWTQFTYVMFWFSAVANVSNLYAASTGMTMGLTMWESIACTFGGQFMAGCLMAINGRAGAMYRIPYPVLCRSSFGVWGALWPTLNRAVMSIVWNGVNMTQGAQCLYVFLHAIFPSIAHIPDKMGPKSALTSAQMICFVLVYIKVVVYYAGALAMLAWVVALAGGSPAALRASSSVRGAEKSWLICKFLWLGLASCGTFISNAADLQRYARRPSDVLVGQIISFPLSGLLVAVLGNVIAGSSESIFGELIWNPLNFLDKLMDGDRYTHGNRTACAFISLAFIYSTVFSAIFENSIPAGNDIAALCPRYITVKRGFFICAILSFAICPWYLLATASIFITFLSSYQIFLSAIAGILICDYYLIRRGHLHIPELYTADPAGIYYYLYGINLRGFGAYVIAIAPNFYGFLSQMGVSAPLGIQRFYFVAYPVGLLIAFAVFAGMCWIWWPRGAERVGLGAGWKEPEDYWDEFDEAVTAARDGVVDAW
ncbi:uncharacterized protein BP01DRAFT_372459 [Aspergillus saccharolyticus JOP 1030-1]|uniref:NCS1 nucleoside transporter n=1 Tax=Aspergillus saccharolyticus JOP 1030-1 TaxID=1450539 RepID=A0A318ZHR8_9EURO|nr:hypothetical protein BP01DRAFT_372459 [Aspergillus saccharolyticus JOP 1030-1]PYH47106.1 hypothetical protein BP01DRAFT_372459 [Aspergillus saccharolyticus JOP 1030-1]